MYRRRRKKLSPIRLVFLYIIGMIWLVSLYHFPIILDVFSLKFVHPLSTAFMRYSALTYPTRGIKYHWVSYDEISEYLKSAVVIAEDDRFFEHPGIDIKAIENAAKVNWERGRFAFGASTISQQLVKNLYLSPSKDPIRKFREVLLAIFIDSYLSKERILELYLNVVEWGPNVFGADATAQYYFKKGAKNLSAPQSAFLASILPNPIRLGRGGYHISSRAQSILNRIQ